VLVGSRCRQRCLFAGQEATIASALLRLLQLLRNAACGPTLGIPVRFNSLRDARSTLRASSGEGRFGAADASPTITAAKMLIVLLQA
jgi:hypothetical protein